MKRNLVVLLLSLVCSFLFASRANADDHAYGYTGIDIDETSWVVHGYHRTEVDYNTEVYYTPSVCGSLHKDGVEQVRGCHDGLITASVNTQTAYSPDSAYSALSDHYVRMEYEEEDPYNPGYYYFQDVLGYSFTNGGSHPIDWFFVPAGIYYTRPDASIRLGDTYVPNCACQTPMTNGEWTSLHSLFPQLRRAQTCKLGSATETYNCMAWTLDDTSRWWWDEADANGDGKISVSELNAFYESKGKSNIAYYGPSTGDVVHVAKKSGGSGDDCSASSKLGQSIRMAHKLTQLEGGYYSNIVGGN